MPATLQLDPSALRGAQSSYAPKLCFEERCAILAAFINGASPRVLAEAYGINRRTVAAITNEHSLHYRDVRQKRRAMGGLDFAALYLDDAAIARINAAAASPVAKMTVAEYEKYAPTFNPRASSEMGTRQWRVPATEYDPGNAYVHFVEVYIVDVSRDWNMGGDPGVDGKSWGWRDKMCGTSGGEWITGFKTSKEAWAHAKLNITDDPLIAMGKRPQLPPG